ncbi:MAG: glycosyltransferase family 2 protein [Candidatus Omnitrophica bacterium]|nr:glycosyltransferase family 2 protein [Candidatus Omnitrophota bacterium]
MVDFSVVIPAYNEADAVALLHKRLLLVMESLHVPFEIVYVNDGSTDATLEVIRAFALHDKRVRYISLAQNSGQSAALSAGFRKCRGEWIITLDADGQNPPEEIPRLMEFISAYDCVTGVRNKRNDSAMRKIDSFVARLFRALILSDSSRDVGCSLRIFRRKIVDSFPYFRNFHRFFLILVRRRGFSVKEVNVAHHKRLAGTSKYGTLKRLQEGVCDLAGVLWLKSRLLIYEVSDEI